MRGVSTHILDLASGAPAEDVAVRLSALGADGGVAILAEGRTNSDGRAELLPLEALKAGGYRLAFEIGAYFRRTGTGAAEPGFLETVVIDFNMAEPVAHHHVPLLVSPFGYSTYRGS